MTSFLIMVNVLAHPGRLVKDFCAYKRCGYDLSSEHTVKRVGNEVDGLCILMEDEFGKVIFFWVGFNKDEH